MVGNLSEWVADWVLTTPLNSCLPSIAESDGFDGDNCFNGAAPGAGPTALIRGRDGVFAVDARRSGLLIGEQSLGFRAAR
jgi:hypothetical protein